MYTQRDDKSSLQSFVAWHKDETPPPPKNGISKESIEVKIAHSIAL